MRRAERRAAIDAGEEEYFTGKPCKRGHIAKRKVNGGCVECLKIHVANRSKVDNKKKLKHWRRSYPEKSLIRLAKKRGWPVDITIDDVIIPATCPVLGIPLIKGERMSANSPTLDRVDAAKGYIKGNVQVISWRANRLKSDATLEEVKAILKYMKRNLP